MLIGLKQQQNNFSLITTHSKCNLSFTCDKHLTFSAQILHFPYPVTVMYASFIVVVVEQCLTFHQDLLQWPRELELSELQCSEPGWLVRQGVGSSPTPASMWSQVSACYEIKFLGRYRGFACVLFKLWQAITPGSGASGVCWEPPVWITDGRGQRSYRKTAYRHPVRKTRRLS